MTVDDRGASMGPAGSAAEVLRRDLQGILAEAQSLRADVHRAEQARKRATTAMVAILGVMAIFVALMVALGWQSNLVLTEVKDANVQAADTNARIADCTTPGGACYESGRQRTSEAIHDIIKVSIYMAQCARLFPNEAGPEYDRKLEACVTSRLSSDKAPAPAPSTGG